MSHALPIETDGVTAGVIVAQGRWYRFIATDQRFRLLDGSTFAHQEDARQAAARLAQAHDGAAAAPLYDRRFPRLAARPAPSSLAAR